MRYIDTKADLIKLLDERFRKSTKQIISYLYPLDGEKEGYGRSLGTQTSRRLRMGRSRLKSENPAAVYSSDHSRAFTTAVHIASHHKLKPIPVPDLREDYLGIFEGWQWEVKKDEAKEKMWQDRQLARERGELHFTVGGCETLHDHALRVQKFFGRVEKSHPAGTVIVVSHGGTINRIMEHFEFKSIRDGYVGYKNTAVSILVKTESSYRLDVHNDITHLE